METIFLQKVCDELKTALADFGWTATIDKEKIDREHRVGGDVVIYQKSSCPSLITLQMHTRKQAKREVLALFGRE